MKRIIMSVTALIMALLLAAGIALPAEAAGVMPIAENLELCTYRNTSVGGTLTAYDPDGGELLFEISTKPVKGDITLEDNGSFVYTPFRDKKGRDYFGYRVSDAEGNISQEATVLITIQKNKPCIEYSDMKGSGAEYAAVLLCEKGLYTGKKVCGRYQFCPEEAVSRGEFLSMCMELTGSSAISGVVRTGFSDDESIPLWMKGYVAAAAMDGYAAAGNEFSPDAPITPAEAALMLRNAMALESVSYMPLDEELEPVFAQACADLSAYGIAEKLPVSAETLTRAEAALLLCEATKLGR